MSEKIKLNIEGDAYVIPGEEPYNEAEVKSAHEADWNDFQILADVPEDEAAYVPPKETNLSEKTRKGAIFRRILGQNAVDIYDQTV